ncbi:ABC transporter permease [Bacteroidota bacterium]|nr:ABC transporter permease [Bacteroidota bacterium]
MSDKNPWTIEIYPVKSFLKFDFKALWSYKDLLLMFVKRDIVTIYKQTILGPIWFFIQPIMTSFIFMFVFSDIAKISTDGIPNILFYLNGLIIWNFFSESFIMTSDTFLSNSNIFSKVYFPRLIIPISKLMSGLIKFFIQFTLFIAVWAYYFFNNDGLLNPNFLILTTPFLITLMGLIGLGFGLIVSSITRKYRDLKFFINFAIQLTLYITPIIYPVSQIKSNNLKFLLKFNPLSHLIEAFKFSFLGKGTFTLNGLIYSFLFTLVVLFIGIFYFNKAEKDFIDTI